MTAQQKLNLSSSKTEEVMKNILITFWDAKRKPMKQWNITTSELKNICHNSSQLGIKEIKILVRQIG